MGEAQANHVFQKKELDRIAHDLRTPLSAILGFGQLLAMDDLTTEQRESVDQILGAGRRMLAMMSEFFESAAAQEDHVNQGHLTAFEEGVA